MVNKDFQEYTEKLYNIDANYEAILSRNKKGVSKMKHYKKKVLNIAAMFIVVILVGILSTQIYAKIQWDIEFKEYENRQYETGAGSVNEVIKAGYTEDIKMDYIAQDGIRVKVNSLMITDYQFEADIDFQFDEDIVLDSEQFDFGYAVYDDENNIYGVIPRLHVDSKKYDYNDYTKYLYEELGIKYDNKNLLGVQYHDSAARGNKYAKDRNIVSTITMDSSKGFPRSKKIYIRIFDLGYTMYDVQEENGEFKLNTSETFTISDAEWIFEIEVPDKFYERETTELQLKEAIPEVDIDKISLAETNLVMEFQSESMRNVIISGMDMEAGKWAEVQKEMLYITDGEGNRYDTTSMGTTQEENGLKVTFDVNKTILEKKLYLNVNINGKTYISELIEK